MYKHMLEHYYYSDKICQGFVTGWWCSAGSPVCSTNKTDHHDITELLLKVANTEIRCY
jgi:hypothetical protein